MPDNVSLGAAAGIASATSVASAVPAQAAPPVAEAARSALPAGWEERLLPDGRTFYVDHNTQNTCIHPFDPGLTFFWLVFLGLSPRGIS